MKIKLTGKETFIGRVEINKEPFKLSRGSQYISTEVEKPAIRPAAPSEPLPNLDHLLQLRLSELAKREMAIKVYSEILRCDVWLCSNKTIALKVEADDPGAITYTIREMRELIKLNPGPEDLENIYNAKNVFHGSRIVDSWLKEESDD